MTSFEAPLLGTLFQEGYLSALDYYFSLTVGRMAHETNPLALLGAAIVSRETAGGHICVDLNMFSGKPIISAAGDPIPGMRWPDEAAWKKALEKSPLVADGAATAPLVRDSDGRLYMARYWDYQRRLVAKLRGRARKTVETVNEDLLELGLSQLFPNLTPAQALNSQRLAAEMCVRRLLAIISGGPGTGKTTTVVRILALIIAQALASGESPPRIRITAPTGKAAARLNEAVAAAKADPLLAGLPDAGQIAALIPQTAMTLHRLMGRGNPMREERFRHHDRRLLPVDVLVVDESSMVDLSLMTRLLEALPDSARLILLGDKDQLSSVEAGAVLGDICGGPALVPFTGGNQGSVVPDIRQCIVQLTHSYRFTDESGIGRLSHAINAGNRDEVYACLKSPEFPSVSLVESDSTERWMDVLSTFVETYYVPGLEETDPSSRLGMLQRFRIFCAHRKGGAGVEFVNAAVTEILKRKTGKDMAGEWYDGRPIMVTENDYQLGIYNGDIGVVGPASEGRSACSVFFPGIDRGLRSFSPFRLPAHETVYAMTVHKSQGAEFDHVLLLLPPRRSPIVTRELLYTAVTRARVSVTIFGSGKVIGEAVETPVQRASGIREELWAV